MKITNISELLPAPANGEQGEHGKWPDYQGDWSSTAQYTCSDFKMPYVSYSSQYYYMKETGTAIVGQDPATSAANGGMWKLGDKSAFMIVGFLMAEFAKLASAIFSGDYMLSQYGAPSNGTGTQDANYTTFNKNSPDSGWVPNLFINFLTGYLHCKNADITGTVNATSGSFTNIVQNKNRSPFTFNIDSITTNYNDNILVNPEGAVVSYSVPTGVEQCGRHLTILCGNSSFSGTNAGTAAFDIASGCYFFEDGIKKTELRLSNEAVQLVGIGTSSVFNGWLVLSRSDFVTAGRYGSNRKVLGEGIVTYISSSSSISLQYNIYDRTLTLSASRISDSHYKITLPDDWANTLGGRYVVSLTGIGESSGGGPTKATLLERHLSYFIVETSDDSTSNDGSFYFEIISTYYWNHL